MEPEFWHNAWESGRAGWRQQRPNTRLQRYWPELGLPPRARVLVPLCGDSPDLLWLHQQGYEVVGVELNEGAVRHFFESNSLTFSEHGSGSLRRFDSDRVTIFCGDFFTLQPAQTGAPDAAYDRAATVALPAALRSAYAAQLSRLLPNGSVLLLISMVFDQQRMKGPPFSVPSEAIEALYGQTFTVRRIASATGPEILGHLSERGLDSLEEVVYRLDRRDGTIGDSSKPPSMQFETGISQR